jgi:hypothetical protein
MISNENPSMEGPDDLGESILRRGNTLADELIAETEKAHFASQHIAKSILTGKITLAEQNLRRVTSSFLDYERHSSETLQQVGELPKLLRPDQRVFGESLIARLTAQRDTNRELLQTFNLAVSNLRQLAGSRISNTVNLALLILTVASIGLALASYRTATTTLNDARESSKRQEVATSRQVEALNASKKALDSVSSATVSQQALLKKMADSTGKQVDILAAEQAREMEEADVTAVMCYPAGPSLLIVNNGPHRVATDVFYEVRLRNLSATQDGQFGLLATAAPKVDYILPRRAVGPEALAFYPSIVSRQPKEGDRLFGYATVMCPVCRTTRVYWMYIQYGKDGVFAEGSDREFPFFNLDENNAPATVDKFLKLKHLLRMPTRLE